MKRKKNKEYRESQITTLNFFGFKIYFTWKHNLKKRYLNYQVLLTVFMRCRVFEKQ